MKIFATRRPRLTKFGLLFLLTLFFPINSFAMDVNFQWTANSDQVTGYKLYYKVGMNSAPPYTGTGLDQGKAPILIGPVTTYTVTGLDSSKTYHFVLSAYNKDGESGLSKVITVNPTPTINEIFVN